MKGSGTRRLNTRNTLPHPRYRSRLLPHLPQRHSEKEPKPPSELTGANQTSNHPAQVWRPQHRCEELVTDATKVVVALSLGTLRLMATALRSAGEGREVGLRLWVGFGSDDYPCGRRFRNGKAISPPKSVTLTLRENRPRTRRI